MRAARRGIVAVCDVGYLRRPEGCDCLRWCLLMLTLSCMLADVSRLLVVLFGPTAVAIVIVSPPFPPSGRAPRLPKFAAREKGTTPKVSLSKSSYVSKEAVRGAPEADSGDEEGMRPTGGAGTGAAPGVGDGVEDLEVEEVEEDTHGRTGGRGECSPHALCVCARR